MQAEAATDIQLSQAAIQTALKDPDHLKRWLDASSRRWMVFNGIDLIDALPWPSGVEAFMQVVMAYRDHRRVMDSGRTEIVEDPTTGEMVEVPVPKDESLEVEELDRAIRYLVAQLLEKDPDWRLSNPAL